jgi:hypothetical protein
LPFVCDFKIANIGRFEQSPKYSRTKKEVY